MTNDAHETDRGPSRMKAVFERQAATALRLRSSTAQERIEKIRKLRDAVIAHTEDWYKAAYGDFKKPPGEVDLAEILPICVEANDAIRHLKQWMKPRRVWPTLLTLGMSAARALLDHRAIQLPGEPDPGAPGFGDCCGQHRHSETV